MRILILSDLHGKPSYALRAFAAQPQAAACFFLGDGERDFDDACACLLPCAAERIFKVRGNCDFVSFAPDTRLEFLHGMRIFACHGHLFSVKAGDDALLREAVAQRAAIAVYGHTHRGVHRFAQGIHLFNPGCAARGEYGVMDLEASGICCLHMRL